MSRYHSYLNSATSIIKEYDGSEPFTSFLKKYFAKNKKFGSRDRKQISHLCYCYFRLGKERIDMPADERVLTALFLCSSKENDILASLKPVWNEKAALSIEKKLLALGTNFLSDNIFPWKEELSGEIKHSIFCQSFLIQPDLFIRIRPGNKESIIKKIENKIPFQIVSDTCIAFPNATKITEFTKVDKEAIIQDLSSQRVAGFLQMLQVKTSGTKISIWDCCAASGGKSIMAKDIFGDIDLTVSDIRETILINLKKRFKVAGIERYRAAVINLIKPIVNFTQNSFNLIIADLPCTGSGTWSRTPEQLFFFNANKIDEYAKLQRQITGNIASYLKPGGFLLYITCSVFKKENEEAITFITRNFGFELIKMEILNGYTEKADTMFAALLKKIL